MVAQSSDVHDLPEAISRIVVLAANAQTQNETTSSMRYSGNDRYESGDIAWTLVSSALVWLMVPGIGFFYSGMARSKSALSLIILCCWSIAVVSVQWFMFGYSLAFSREGSLFIGNLNNGFLVRVTDQPAESNKRIPDILFCLYQCMIAGITPALVIGATAERGRFLPTIVFMLLWTTFVYDFIAYWTWNVEGWAHKLGVLDFAGGNAVHIASGAAAISYAHILGEREGNLNQYKPHNMVQVVLGTSLIWFGWFGFNGGSALGSNIRSCTVIMVTNLSASIGGLTWALLDYKKEKKFSALSFCFGAVAGLVAITPASGYISPQSGIAFGFLGSLGCHVALRLKDSIGLDDAFDVVAVHGIGGLIGTFLTGVFAEKAFAELDGMTDIKGGWIDQNWMQVPKQLAGAFAALVWSLVVTFGILFGMNKIPGLQLRAESKHVREGLDKEEIGEAAYHHNNDQASDSA